MLIVTETIKTKLMSRSLKQRTSKINPPTKNGHTPPTIESRKRRQSEKSRRLHSWRCLFVSSFKFQPFDDTFSQKPKTLTSQTALKGTKQTMCIFQSPILQTAWFLVRRRRYIEVFQPLFLIIANIVGKCMRIISFSNKSKNFTSDANRHEHTTTHDDDDSKTTPRQNHHRKQRRNHNKQQRTSNKRPSSPHTTPHHTTNTTDTAAQHDAVRSTQQPSREEKRRQEKRKEPPDL